MISQLKKIILKLIFVAGNDFSKDMEEKFEKLRVDNPRLTVLSEWASEEFKGMVKKTFN